MTLDRLSEPTVSKNKVSRAQRDHKTENGGISWVGGVGGEVRQNKTNAMKHFKIQINAISAVSLFYFAQFFGVWRSFRFYFSQPTNQPASLPLPSLLLLLLFFSFL